MAKVGPFSPERQREWDERLREIGIDLSSSQRYYMGQQWADTHFGHPILKKIPDIRACLYDETPVDLVQVC